MLRDGVRKEMGTQAKPTEGRAGQKEKVNVWRSLMSLQFLSAVPLGPECTSVCVWVGKSVCIHLGNTGLCIIYQTAVSFVLLFTLRARSCANRDPSQQEWQSQKQFNWRLKQLIMPSLSLQCNYSSMRRLIWLNTTIMLWCTEVEMSLG